MKERRVIMTKLILGFVVVFYATITCTFAADTVSANQTLRYNETIVSAQQKFELGFFSPGESKNHYVEIWYKQIPGNRTVVWVANGNAPLSNTSCELTLTHQGVLILQYASMGNVVWSSANSSTKSGWNPIGQLLDTGNFIIYNKGDVINLENPIWQSFDFISNTLLPGMKSGKNLVTGIDRHLTSWKSDDDPASGEFSFGMDTRGYPQLIVTAGGNITFRVGLWNGLGFNGFHNLKPNPVFNSTFALNQREVYYQYNLINTSSSTYTRLVLQPSGHLEELSWDDSTQKWIVVYVGPKDQCEEYAVCGPFGSCKTNDNNVRVCECLDGFEPTSIDWSTGCSRTTPLDCGPGEGFNKYTHLKLPDSRGSWYNQTMTLVECEKMCKSNCSCTAYTNSNFSGTGSGCLLWFGDLTDIRTFLEFVDPLFIRMPASLLGNSKRSSRVGVIVPVAFVVWLIPASITLCYCLCRNNQQHQGTPRNEWGQDPEYNSGDEDLELPLFRLSTILKATNNFSINNKLGEGGFGPVYKGVLGDELEIAVKRLAKTSNQGFQEFKNEVISISKLQHRNLVKLLGYCIEGAEKMLLYEYMPNKGLDSLIFDKIRSELLDWSARYRIINGIARGLLYLHQDSRLRIIHRDLKVSNILLDKDMNPKISDFGLARSFGGNQLEANTNRVVGTYGYMAPEYAGDGIFSIKSDVYSFGVIVLEIVCGEKNRGFVHKEHWNNLTGHAWELHNEGRSLELVTKCLGESINVSQVVRSIHVSLLCVQCHPEDRPSMTSVILMLGSETPLPSPKKPGFYVEKPNELRNLQAHMEQLLSMMLAFQS